MSNLDNITRKILEDARAEAEAILQDAEKDVNQQLEKLEAETRFETERELRYARERARGLSEQFQAHAALKARDRVLQAKQNVIARVLAEAEKRLDGLSDAELGELIKAALAKAPLEEGDVLLLPEDRHPALPAGTAVETDPHMGSGFSVRRKGGVIEKHDFSEVMHVLQEELESDILHTLKGSGS